MTVMPTRSAKRRRCRGRNGPRWTLSLCILEIELALNGFVKRLNLSASAINAATKVGQLVEYRRSHVLESVGLAQPFVGMSVDDDMNSFFFQHHLNVFTRQNRVAVEMDVARRTAVDVKMFTAESFDFRVLI